MRYGVGLATSDRTNLLLLNSCHIFALLTPNFDSFLYVFKWIYPNQTRLVSTHFSNSIKMSLFDVLVSSESFALMNHRWLQRAQSPLVL